MGQLVLALCRNFEQEARAALHGCHDVALRFFPARCGRPPLRPQELRDAAPDVDRAEVLGSVCCSCLSRSSELPEGWRVHALENCFELLAPRSMLAAQLRDGAYVITPGWLRHWRDRIAETGFEDDELVRQFFGESTTRLLLLDTGLDPSAQARLEEVAAYLRLPVAVAPVGIELLRERLMRTRAEAALESERRRHNAALAAANEQAAEYATAFDLLGCVTELLDERDVVQRTLDVCSMLFAPRRLAYLSLGVAAETIEARPPLEDAAERRLLGERLSGLVNPPGGFAVAVEHRGQRFGVLGVEEVAFPLFLERYIVLASTVARVCGLAVANARAFQEVKHAKESLAFERERLAVTLDSIGDGVIATDREGRIMLVNRVCAELTGFTAREADGRPLADVFELLDEDTREPLANPVREVLRIGRAVDLVRGAILVARDGSEHHIADSAAPILDRSGDAVGVVVVFRDVTDQRRTRQLQRVLGEATQIVASSLDIPRVLRDVTSLISRDFADACVIDLDTHPAPSQRRFAATRLAGAGEAALQSMPRSLEARRLVALQDASPILAAVDVDELHELIPPSARVGRAALLVVPIRTVEAERPVGTMTFVSTASGGFDGEDLAFARELARRTGLGLENARLLETTRQAVQSRDRFLSIASHELKTPLTSLLLQGQAMRRRTERGEAISPGQVERLTTTVLRQVRRLQNLVDDMLDVSRIHAGKLDLRVEDVDLSRLVATVLDLHAGDLEASGYVVAARLEQGIRARCDPGRIEQVVTNLLTNAIRYGQSKPLDVLLARVGETASLVVRDRGIGIADEDQPRIFQAFERASAATTSAGGLGLGLYIVAQIVAAHRGFVTLESSPGAGSTFTVSLPLS